MSRDMKSLMRRPDHAVGCKLDGCALVGECFHGAALAEVSRLRETLERVVRACRNCGGSGIAVRRYNFPDLACGAEGCKIARAALATAKGGK